MHFVKSCVFDLSLLLSLLSNFVNDKGCTDGWAYKHAPHKYKVTAVQILGLYTAYKSNKINSSYKTKKHKAILDYK